MAEAKFRKPHTHYKNEPAPSGKKIVYEHREEIGKDGKRKLIKDRAVNIYEKIQASKDQCEIENILRRATEGDQNVLNIVNGQYMDITGAPSSLAEAQQFVIRAKNEFEQLPKDIRAKFENNAEIYVAEFGSDTWADKTGLKAKWAEQENAARLDAEFDENLRKAAADLAKKGAIENE